MLNYRNKRQTSQKYPSLKNQKSTGKSTVKEKCFLVKQLPITYYWDLSDHQQL